MARGGSREQGSALTLTYRERCCCEILKKFSCDKNPQVHLKIAPATETLQKLVDNNEAGTFDFAFIDADKVLVNYRL